MSKRKRKKQSKTSNKPNPTLKHGGRGRAVIITLVLTLGLAVVMLAQIGVLRSTKIKALLSPQPATPSLSPGSPSREYIYAGGRLISTEEPASSSLTAPTNLVTTTASSSGVTLGWGASTGGTVDHNQVERRQSITGQYTVLSGGTASTAFTDNTVTAGVAYLYRVCAVDSSGGRSLYSNVSLGTAVTFDDEPLLVNGVSNYTTIQLLHFTQLRDAVNAVRATAGMAAFDWSSPAPQSQGLIYHNNLNDLRSNLSDALAALGFTRPQYGDPIISGTAIRATDVQQLRNLVRGMSP